MENRTMYHTHIDHPRHLPCLQCDPQSYIKMVQNMIERCILLNMSRDNCIKALARNANIPHVITLTVWRELLKENKSFFLDYFQGVPPMLSIWKAPVKESRFRRKNLRWERK